MFISNSSVTKDNLTLNGHWVADYNSDLRSILSNSTSNIRVAPPKKNKKVMLYMKHITQGEEDTGFFKVGERIAGTFRWQSHWSTPQNVAS